MSKNKHWVENNGCYELHFCKGGEDTVVLTFKSLGTRYFVCDSAEMNAIEEYTEYSSIDEAKLAFEQMYEHHIIHKMEHYFAMLMDWKE